MKYSNRFIYYFCAIHYLKGKKLKEFNEKIKNLFIKNDQQFLKILFEYIDIEVFKTKPIIWQDIWIYNHLKYEKIGKKSNLLLQYQNEIIHPIFEKNNEFLSKLNRWGTYYLIGK